MSENRNSNLYREFDLIKARNHFSKRTPASHQNAALSKLDAWFQKKTHAPHAGGIMVLPTGGGKTFTAVRFLCRGPLSAGYKVLWLAHTHHLLEQAYDSFAPRDKAKEKVAGLEVGLIAEPTTSLNIRVVSGTPGHFPVHTIKASDDVVIITLQTLTQAYKLKHPSLTNFLKAAGDKLLVVFDEAHHSPAPSYRDLIIQLRKSHSQMYLLGLTATPTYTDETKKGWLKKLFPQGILYQVSAQNLMGAGILAKPISEEYA
ncbi:MAG: DEAD/DEAH box helicase family protein, partial [Armatimonadota bacterium]|nr:DEAD/DEAH box helicase family protein [Armatimonadota bacterium]